MKFPARGSREFLSAEQGILEREQGIPQRPRSRPFLVENRALCAGRTRQLKPLPYRAIAAFPAPVTRPPPSLARPGRNRSARTDVPAEKRVAHAGFRGSRFFRRGRPAGAARTSIRLRHRPSHPPQEGGQGRPARLLPLVGEAGRGVAPCDSRSSLMDCLRPRKVRETPHPVPPPPKGVRKDARLSTGYRGRGRKRASSIPPIRT